MGAHFSWFHLIPPIKDGSIFPFLGEEYRQDAHVFFSASTVCLVLIGLALLARKGLDSARAKHGLEGLVPDAGATPRNLMEIVSTALLDLFTSVLGHKDARRFFPFLAGLFLYILFNNLLSLVPGFQPATANMSNNFAMGLTIFVLFNAVGMIRNGVWAYLRHMMGPLLPLAWFFLIVESISFMVRPLSLSLRLGGNLFGDHTVFTVMSDLVPFGVPIPFLGLGMFVSFIQALVFTLLSSVYIALAIGTDEH